jgi:glycosyltransferase involved in cell wall biosynthesis
MKQMLFIAYYFPPMGGAGVQRTLGFVKYLPEYGWQPHILTVSAQSQLQDGSLLEEIPPGLNITRTPIIRPPRQLPWRLRNFISRWVLVVDEQIGWLPFAVSTGRRLIEDGKIKVIYSTSSPYTAHLVASKLHRQTQLPWVADLRDPWIDNPFISFPTKLHRRINENIERSVFSQAERLILNTDASREHYTNKYSGLPAAKFITITNGFDPQDIIPGTHGNRTDSTFTIIHLGSLFQGARSSLFFLGALRKVIQAGWIDPEKIRIIFVGNIDKKTPGYIRQFNLDQSVELLGYLPHQQGINYLLNADLLLLFPYYGPCAELSVPAKLYEYLACQKPILCLADPGACADLVLGARAGSVVPPTDTDKIAIELVRFFHLWEKGELSIKPDLDLVNSFERRKLTSQLANVLSSVIK